MQCIDSSNAAVESHFNREASVRQSLIDLKDLESEHKSNDKLRNDIRNALQKKRPENAHFVLEAINSGNKYVDLE